MKGAPRPGGPLQLDLPQRPCADGEGRKLDNLAGEHALPVTPPTVLRKTKNPPAVFDEWPGRAREERVAIYKGILRVRTPFAHQGLGVEDPCARVRERVGVQEDVPDSRVKENLRVGVFDLKQTSGALPLPRELARYVKDEPPGLPRLGQHVVEAFVFQDARLGDA